MDWGVAKATLLSIIFPRYRKNRGKVVTARSCWSCKRVELDITWEAREGVPHCYCGGTKFMVVVPTRWQTLLMYAGLR